MGETQVASRFALNEFSVTRGELGRIIDFGINIAGTHVVDMRGDGLVVSSATGSTAYALSAGGPLCSPEFRGFVVVPLAPHTLLSRSVITGPSDIVEIDLSKNPESREASYFVDGEIVVILDRAYRWRSGAQEQQSHHSAAIRAMDSTPKRRVFFTTMRKQ